MLARERSLWTLAGGLSVAAGVVAAIVAVIARGSGSCARGHVMDVWWDVAFVALALVPAAGVLAVGRLRRRPGEELTVPVAFSLCVGVILVFACLMVALAGRSCMH